MLDFTLHDKRVIPTRRLLLKEQFRDERARHFAALHFLNGTKEIYTKIFAKMMDKVFAYNENNSGKIKSFLKK